MYTSGLLASSTLVFVHDAISARITENPVAPAITDVDGTTISYGEFGERCDRLAASLRSAGVRPDDPVIVQLSRSAGAVIAMVAVMRAGGAYTPVDLSCPPARLAAMVRNLGTRWLVTDGDPVPEAVAAGLRVVGLEEAAHDARLPDLHPDNLAYILHTSGSTGLPKGVAMTHRGLGRLISWQVSDGPAGLTTALFTATGFDVTFQEVFATLVTGGRLCVLSEQDRRDPDRLLEALRRNSVERLFLPYVALQRLAKAVQRQGRAPESLRHILTAGERLVVTDAISEMFAALPQCRLDNHYGPTETHLAASWRADEHPLPWPTVPPIGTPVSGTRIYLLDENFEPVPVGEPGEIYVSGDALARGYASSPTPTAERFLPDPFAPLGGIRMYRTGDLAQMEPSGVLHFLGRADDQVKVRGYRVEPTEVERALSGHARVRDVAVGVRSLADGVDGLVAYVVADTPGPSVSALSEWARATLPPYMVPSRYVFLKTLPLTTSGKLDRGALAEVELPAVAVEKGGVAEDIVAEVWARVLGHSEFEPDDDFFDVGGDSLLATWVMAELGQRFGRELPLSALLENSTVEELAGAVSEPGTRPECRQSTSEILTLGTGRSNRALFLFHALGGEVFAYRELSQALTSPVRVLGVRWAGEGYGGRSILELARVHTDQIRTVQPHGPYLLGGWSFGGVLAFEVARVLAARGERVEFLGLIDANPVLDPITGLPQEETTYAEMLTRVLDQLDRSGPADAPTDVSALVADEDWVALMGGSAPTGLTAGHLRRHLSLALDGMRAVMNYRAKPYEGVVELFQADGTAPHIQQDLAARLRDSVLGQVRVRPVPGDHTGLLRGTNATALAAGVDRALERLGRTDRES